MHYKAVQQRIAVGDYFVTLATVLDLLRQELVREGVGGLTSAKILSECRDELLYLQKNYSIVRRTPRAPGRESKPRL